MNGNKNSLTKQNTYTKIYNKYKKKKWNTEKFAIIQILNKYEFQVKLYT